MWSPELAVWTAASVLGLCQVAQESPFSGTCGLLGKLLPETESHPAHSCVWLRGKLCPSRYFGHHLQQSACIMNPSEFFHLFKFSQIVIFYMLFTPDMVSPALSHLSDFSHLQTDLHVSLIQVLTSCWVMGWD